MPTYTEMEAAMRWVIGTLRATGAVTGLLASATSVYPDLAPETAAAPLIVITVQAASDTNTQDLRHLSEYIVLVKAIVETQKAVSADLIMKAADVVLHGVVATVDSYIVNCVREGQMRLPTFEDRKNWRQSINKYRISVRTGT